MSGIVAWDSGRFDARIVSHLVRIEVNLDGSCPFVQSTTVFLEFWILYDLVPESHHAMIFNTNCKIQ